MDTRISADLAHQILVALEQKGYAYECNAQQFSLSGEYPVLEFDLGMGCAIWIDTTFDGDFHNANPANNIVIQRFVNAPFTSQCAVESEIWPDADVCDADNVTIADSADVIADNIIAWTDDANAWLDAEHRRMFSNA